MRTRKGAPDFILFLTVLILLSIGLVMVFSASAYFAGDPEGPFGDPFHFFKRQLFGAALGIGVMLLMMNYDYQRLRRWVGPMLIAAFVMLVMVLVPGIGMEVLGARRWIDLGFISFQPSELVKIFIIIFTAYGLAQKKDRIQNLSTGLFPFLAVTGLAALLILAQPDLGTAATLCGTIFIMLFTAGARGGHLTTLAGLGAVGVAAAIYFEPYRMRRFTAFLDPEADPTGAGWNILNALMSLASGGLLGMGLGQGRHSKFLFLPERHTDFIFAAIGEELGFIGGCLVILLFVLLVWRGFRVAITCPDTFGSLLAAGLVSGIALQAFINIGVVTGSLPVTGITLPFVSFGSTSLIFSLMGVGIILNISKYSSRK
ncbi:putative lipid II flippase FtsW [Desulfoscipio gibsoniae]|uniref:Probable peptidoglycan glycosyltransferase FtsW n=1 Tax=Desulfoscipio gibsoniae DSM 7213 TaxID=767817 RepID=R4KTP9_9FIRM|nr:putative lipid II flippase FtsW [Desulfoscipio gibsoniae]AGL02981.1 cell division protein FtsW [Desulfoscipio gibsoniae DSM 7213]